MSMDRRQFVKLSFFVTSAALSGAGALVSACSSDESSAPPGPSGTDAAAGKDTSAPAPTDAGPALDAAKDTGGALSCRASITQNHGHAIIVPVGDLDSSTAKTYSIKGTSAHDHKVVLDADDFSMLKSGLSVKKTSDFGGETHDHDVTVLCTAL